MHLKSCAISSSHLYFKCDSMEKKIIIYSVRRWRSRSAEMEKSAPTTRRKIKIFSKHTERREIKMQTALYDEMNLILLANMHVSLCVLLLSWPGSTFIHKYVYHLFICWTDLYMPIINEFTLNWCILFSLLCPLMT